MRVQILSGCVAALVAAGCVEGAGPETVRRPQQAQLAEQPISVRIESWGKLQTAWEIQPDGSGLYRSSVGVGGGFHDYDIVTKRFDGEREGYSKVEQLLDPARRYAGKPLPCGPSVTDAPYGELAWGAPPAEKLAFNFGCLGKKAAAVHERVETATRMVSQWSADAPEVERERVRSGK